MEDSAMEGITVRLSSIEGLYFPGGIRGQNPNPSQRKAALFDLLARDAPIFLERYGCELTGDELASFDALRADYEVKWHINRLRRCMAPTEADSRARSTTVRNRRRAYLERLIHAGEYFSEEAMREREPYLHHEYLGRFQDPVWRVLSRPGEKLSETLMRRCEEAMLVEKIRDEQQRLGVVRRDWVGGDATEVVEEEEEEESEEDSEEEGKVENRPSSLSKEPEDFKNATGQESTEPRKQALSVEEMQDQLDQLTYIMQQKFLAGEDTEHLNYSVIDNDERLDDHWLKEANHDAEEKYFDED